jgi:hypothetical protein
MSATAASTVDFKTTAIDHSAIPPQERLSLGILRPSRHHRHSSDSACRVTCSTGSGDGLRETPLGARNRRWHQRSRCRRERCCLVGRGRGAPNRMCRLNCPGETVARSISTLHAQLFQQTTVPSRRIEVGTVRRYEASHTIRTKSCTRLAVAAPSVFCRSRPHSLTKGRRPAVEPSHPVHSRPGALSGPSTVVLKSVKTVKD